MPHVVVVDFDGTLIDGNSFPRWVRYLLARSLLALDARVFLRVLTAAARRRVLRTLTHREFKAALDALPVPADWAESFVQRLETFRRPDVIALLTSLGAEVLVLATAAPSGYALRLKTFGSIQFDHLLVSGFRGPAYVDNATQVKADAVRELLTQLGEDERFTLLTDDSADLPLARGARRVILCHPSKDSLASFHEAGLEFETLA